MPTPRKARNAWGLGWFLGFDGARWQVDHGAIAAAWSD